jgi:hypothetical protein
MEDGVTHAVSKLYLLGPDATEGRLREFTEHYSIEKHVGRHFPPTFLFAPEDDTEVPVENARRMDRALRAAKVRACARAGGRAFVRAGVDYRCRSSRGEGGSRIDFGSQPTHSYNPQCDTMQYNTTMTGAPRDSPVSHGRPWLGPRTRKHRDERRRACQRPAVGGPDACLH